jgi:hypothetical protein
MNILKALTQANAATSFAYINEQGIVMHKYETRFQIQPPSHQYMNRR